jgi:hypothetical protein
MVLHCSPTNTGKKFESAGEVRIGVLPEQKVGPRLKSITLNVTTAGWDELPLVPVIVAV